MPSNYERKSNPRIVTYGGSGCPQGSVAQSFNPERTIFTLLFDEYIASVGPGVAATEMRKNCQINVNLHIPPGFSYSIVTADYRGYVQLERGLKATQKTIYYFQGETKQVSAGAEFLGPLAKDYLVRDAIPITETIWSDCKALRPLNANTQVRIEKLPQCPDSAKGQITTDSIDGKVSHVLSLLWKNC